MLLFNFLWAKLAACICGQFMTFFFFYYSSVTVPHNAKYLIGAKAEINQRNYEDKGFLAILILPLLQQQMNTGCRSQCDRDTYSM